MSQPQAWTPEYAERLGNIGRGEQCPHLATLDVFAQGDAEGVTICTKCGLGLGVARPAAA